MVGFLPPLVQEAPLSGMVMVLLYAASSVGAGAAVGLSLGIVGGSLRGFNGSTAAQLLVAAVAVGSAAIELAGRRAPLLERRRQVPPSWRYDYGPLKAAVLYGGSLGTGLTTYISYAGFYPVLVWAACHGARQGAWIGGVYGMAQCFPVVLAGVAAAAGARPPLHAQSLLPRAMHRAVGVACLGLVAALALAAGD